MNNLREKIESLKDRTITGSYCPEEDGYEMGYVNALDDVLSLPELQQTIEDVENLRKIEKAWNEASAIIDGELIDLKSVKTLKEKAPQFDRLFENLVAEEKCEDCFGYGHLPRSLGSLKCELCNGTGTVERPLTEEEKVESSKFLIDNFKGVFRQGWFELSSGARVVRK